MATEGVIAVAATLGVAFVVGQFTTFGRTAEGDFYAAVAGVIPIFLLALLVEATASFGGFESEAWDQRQLEQDALENARRAREDIERVKADHRRLEEIGGSVDEEFATASEGMIKASEGVIAAAETVAIIGAGLSRIGGAVRRIILGYVVAAIPGEAAALYALAAGTSTTFLLMTAALSLVAMVVLFVMAVLRRFTYHPPPSGE
jgi:hypothetical protein